MQRWRHHSERVHKENVPLDRDRGGRSRDDAAAHQSGCFGRSSRDRAERIPEGFLWGAATAAHQVEGNNTNSDFWVLEHMQAVALRRAVGRCLRPLPSLPGGHRAARLLGFNAYRFSIEWARIEPEQGSFSIAALDHYRRMLAGCHENGLTPLVTF